MDFEPIFDIIEKSGYEGHVVVEAEQEPCRCQSFRICIEGTKIYCRKNRFIGCLKGELLYENSI